MVKVSVFMISYKHEPYIREAIDSIVNQKTNFPFQLVIGEDRSPDGTRAICEEYAQKYPELIHLLPSDKNIGMMANTVRTLEACTGEYVALCEGDDFWPDPLKLQKQVDFLDTHPDYALCFSDVEIVNEPGSPQYRFMEFKKDTYTIEDFIESHENIIPTPSLMMRNVVPHPVPAFLRDALAGDMPLQLLAADKGKAKFMGEKLAAYRNQPGGMSKSPELHQKWRDGLLRTYHEADAYFHHKYSAAFNKQFLDHARWALMHGAADKKGIARLKHYFRFMPQFLKYSEKFSLKEFIYFNTVYFTPGLIRAVKR